VYLWNAPTLQSARCAASRFHPSNGSTPPSFAYTKPRLDSLLFFAPRGADHFSVGVLDTSRRLPLTNIAPEPVAVRAVAAVAGNSVVHTPSEPLVQAAFGRTNPPERIAGGLPAHCSTTRPACCAVNVAVRFKLNVPEMEILVAWISAANVTASASDRSGEEGEPPVLLSSPSMADT
jgi:hypothetical protein